MLLHSNCRRHKLLLSLYSSPNEPHSLSCDTILLLIYRNGSSAAYNIVLFAEAFFYTCCYNIHNRFVAQQTPTRHSGDNDLEIGVGRVYWLFALQRASSQMMCYLDRSFLQLLRKMKCLFHFVITMPRIC